MNASTAIEQLKNILAWVQDYPETVPPKKLTDPVESMIIIHLAATIAATESTI